ncbi:PadR family transcriptional regulator [Salegentibacter sp. LM13S]|uniref:PadR family transcriptional regulator n=1 Tax=Salegentibacter lacus TaxID=2873599 RepID=UPI001CCFE357|nr:PadR family transcriptional regulator [Salegentibacter lacus]MBZ9631909.1 PadR family transcriptional regulator [Salegentibacter lacus]
MKNEDNLNELLLSWENTYKKGQLTLWIFMALQESRKYVDEIKSFIEKKSNGTISCEEQSLYRALRKYEHINVLTFELKEGNKGPERKYYSLTNLGQELFKQFVNRNIKLFYSEEIKNILKLNDQ